MGAQNHHVKPWEEQHCRHDKVLHIKPLRNKNPDRYTGCHKGTGTDRNTHICTHTHIHTHTPIKLSWEERAGMRDRRVNN